MSKKKDFSAYMTVEACLLFPIILLLLVSLLNLVFFKYNQTMAFQNAAITALYGKSFSYEDEINEELTGRMYGVLEKLNDNQYLALSELEQKVNIEHNDITIIQNMSMKMPLFGEETSEDMTISEKMIIDTKNNIFYMRQIRKVRKEND